MILATAPKLNKINFSPLIKLNGKPIKKISTSDYLGLIMDKKLSWRQYISSLERKISSALMVLRQIAFFPEKAKITLYHILSKSRLRYYNTVWGNCGSNLKNQLQRLKDRAARIITKGNDADNLLAQLGFLNAQQLINFDTSVMVHKTLYNTVPSYFSGMLREMKAVHNRQTTDSRHGLFPTHHNLKTGLHIFSHYECSVWNRIEMGVKEKTNINYFKKI